MKNNRKNRALFKIRAKHGKLPIGTLKIKLLPDFDKEKFIEKWKEYCSKGQFFVFNSHNDSLDASCYYNVPQFKL